MSGQYAKIVEIMARAQAEQVERMSEDLPGTKTTWRKEGGEKAWAALGYRSRKAWVDEAWPNYVLGVWAAIWALEAAGYEIVRAHPQEGGKQQ